MPNANGEFQGQGWSRRKELSWDRIFNPKPKGPHVYMHPSKVTPVTKP